MLALLVLHLCICFSIAYNDSVCCLAANEYYALKDFYNSLNGLYWLQSVGHNSWNFTTTNSSLTCPCTDNWVGLSCYFIGDSCVVKSLSLSTLNLSGSIPESIGNFSSLTYFRVDVNDIYGTLPSSLWNLVNLTTIFTSNNFITGSISEAIGNLSKLEYLYLQSNFHTGPIPKSIGNLSSIVYIKAWKNFLSQSLPPEFCKLNKLVNFYIYINMLSGSLPSCLGNLSSLQNMQMFTNSLSQQIPDSITEIQALKSFVMYKNPFTGSIPVNMGNWINLSNFKLMSTYITGSIPPSIGSMISLVTFVAYINYFHGCIPAEIGNLKLLSSLQLQANCLSGTIPTTIGDMTSLEIFAVYTNFLTGPVHSIFNVSNQFLTQVLLNNNYFTGPLPYSLFGTPTLTAFISSVNCMYGSIPESICDSDNLNVFVIDGISSAATCQNAIFPNLHLNTYYLGKKHITGSVPNCLFGMQNLQYIHLSGNGIASKLDDSITVGPNLTTLVLSHNSFTGSIPMSFQDRSWTYLDLSYNKIGGTLSPRFHSQIVSSCIVLEVNRISGDIPNSLTSMQNISILDGNIFYCGYNRHGLPHTDPNYAQYDCASNNFNMMISVWFAFIFIFVVVLWRWKKIRDRIQEDMAALNAFPLLQLFFEAVKQQALMLTLCIILVLLPVYGALRAFNSTHSYLYAWTLSAAFLSGITPTVVLIVVWFIFSVVVLLRSETYALPNFMRNKISRGNCSNITNRWLAVNSFVLLLTNFTVVVVINGLYVYVSITQATAAVYAATVALALFKLVWTRLVLQAVKRRKQLSINRFWPRVSLLTANNVAIPIIATLCVDTSCFYNTFKAAATIVINVIYTGCYSYSCIDGICVCIGSVASTIIIDYPPPFIYGFQCTSSLLTIYVPVFTIVLLLETFLIPLRSMMVNWWEDTHGVLTSDNKVMQWFIAHLIHDDLSKPVRDTDTSLINCDSIMMVLINHFVILLTWGVIFPPLAVLACLAVYVRSNHMQIAIGIKLKKTDRIDKIDLLDRDCSILPEYCHQSVPIMTGMSCILMALFAFDMVGDTSGGYGIAGAVAVIVTLGPLLVTFCYRSASDRWSRSVQGSRNASDVKKRGSEIELSCGIGDNNAEEVMNAIINPPI